MQLSEGARKQLAPAWIEAMEAELAGVGEATVTLSALERAIRRAGAAASGCGPSSRRLRP